MLQAGSVHAPIIAANLNTLMTAAGTSYFPDLKGKLLLIEEMDAPWSQEERSLRQLQQMGVFDVIAGLIVSKPEVPAAEGAHFSLDDLILETVGADHSYPIISDFDCGHTVPMLTLAQMAKIELCATNHYQVEFRVIEPLVDLT